MTLERLWAGWRSDYVAGVDRESDPGCFLCRLADIDDEQAGLVLERDATTITVMNLYPYGSGHVLVAPRRHVGDLADLGEEEANALMAATRRAVAAITSAYAPDGVNLGANLGRAAGAGLPSHLHMHALPRWSGDTNFMTSVAETRVLPESLETGWHKLRAAWPRQ